MRRAVLENSTRNGVRSASLSFVSRAHEEGRKAPTLMTACELDGLSYSVSSSAYSESAILEVDEGGCRKQVPRQTNAGLQLIAAPLGSPR